MKVAATVDSAIADQDDASEESDLELDSDDPEGEVCLFLAPKQICVLT